MGIFDIFNGQQNQAQPQPQPGNIPEPGKQQVDNSAAGSVPGAAPVPESTTANDPLANYKDLWEPVKNAGGAPDNSMTLDPTKLQEVIGKASFTGSVTPAQLQAIASGGENAVAAFQESMNAVAQNVMLQATLASNKMAEQMVQKALAAQEAKFPKLIKQHNTSEQLSAANPLYSNPAVKPILEAVQSQLQAKNPNASAAEIVEMSQNFVNVLAEQFGPKPAQANTPESFDWEKFLQ